MPLVTFTPSIAPSPGTKLSPKIKLHSAEFGDGYTQDVPNGLNHIRESLSYKWDGLTEIQMREIRDFFRNLGGFRPFYFTPRGEDAPMKWTCKEWSVSDRTPWSLEAKFEQSFTNEV